MKSEPLTDKIPNLLPTLQLDDEEKTAVYTGYLSGEYLDGAVNPERTGFSFADHLELGFADTISWHELLQASVASAREFSQSNSRSRLSRPRMTGSRTT